MLRFLAFVLAVIPVQIAVSQEFEPLSSASSGRTQASPPPAWLPKLERALLSNPSIEILVEFAASPADRERAIQPQSNQTSNEAALTDARRSIASTARSLESKLLSRQITIQGTYDYQPMLRATITAETLYELLDFPEIVNVYLNEQLKPEAENSFLAAQQERGARSQAAEYLSPQSQTTNSYINADDAHNKGFRGQGFAVAIVDDGINRSHNAFQGKIVAEACFSSKGTSGQSLCPGGAASAVGSGAASACPGGNNVCSHGSHVAGIAAGKDTLGSPILRGVAPDANIVAIQVFNRQTSTTICDDEPSCLRASTSDLVAALDWLIANASTYKIVAVNMSLGGGEYSTYCDSSSALASGINTLHKMGVLTVIAAGNEGLSGEISHPACVKAAIAVSSVIITVPETDHNHSSIVDLLAPGYLVLSADATGTDSFTTKSGTSMATPHVTGSIAILKSKMASATVDQIEYAMKKSGPSVTWPTWTWTTPRLDVDAALDVLGQNPPPAGVALIGVLPGSLPVDFSYIRLMNVSSTSGTATLTLIQDDPKKILGTYTTTVPARASIQLRVNQIEQAIGTAASADSFVSIYVSSSFVGFAQDVVFNDGGQSLTNLSACPQITLDPKTFLGNVHTALLPDYPSYIMVHNTGDAPARAVFDLYDSNNGTSIGSVQTGVEIEPNTSTILTAQGAYNALKFVPNPSQYHVNFILRSGFKGIAQHIVNNDAAGVFTDMSVKCPI